MEGAIHALLLNEDPLNTARTLVVFATMGEEQTWIMISVAPQFWGWLNEALQISDEDWSGSWHEFDQDGACLPWSNGDSTLIAMYNRVQRLGRKEQRRLAGTLWDIYASAKWELGQADKRLAERKYSVN
jgi:hypothetical protein